MTDPAIDTLAVPGRGLGKRPPLAGRRALWLRDVLSDAALDGAVPPVPVDRDYLAGLPFGMYGNSRWGTCGPTATANSRRAVTALLDGTMRSPTLEDAFDLYRRSGNPRFDPTLPDGGQDQGVYLHEMLDQVHSGGIGGVRSIAHAKVDPDDRATLRAATAVFGPALIWGLDLTVAQDQQTNTGTWDYVPGSGQWGGHAVLGGQYDPDSLACVTWARVVDMTDRFVAEQADEVWVMIWPEHLRDRTFLDGVDLPALRSMYRSTTGREIPIPPVDPAEPPPFSPGCLGQLVNGARRALGSAGRRSSSG